MKKYRHHSLFFLATIFVASIIFTACNNSETKDAAIKAEAEKALKADPAGTDVAVEVKDHVVILSGNCINEKAKERTTRIVEMVPHVKSVVNNCTVLHETAMTDDELNTRLYALTKDLTTVNAIKIGSMNGIVQVAGPVTKKEWVALKAEIDKLNPKGYDTASLTIE